MTGDRTTLSRRGLLSGALGLTALAGMSRSGIAGASDRQRVLVLVELNGGNDSLNTVVPYADPAYRRARPGLALERDQVIQLDEHLGLNTALAPLRSSWESGQMGVVLGVGYPRANRSHFRSIEIWNSASESDEVTAEGWVSRVGLGEQLPGSTDAVVLGGQAGPLAGAGIRTVVMRRPERFLRRAGNLEGRQRHSESPALEHILGVRSALRASAQELEARLEAAPKRSVEMPKSQLGDQLEIAARLILAGIPLSAIKVQQSGYDTHAGQAGPHRRLLSELAEALAAFRGALVRAGHWDSVLVMTYAEFGRRVAQNASGGTDHGTAAAHFLLGGSIRGGLVGRQPSLTDLEGGDLRHGIDFRQLYATVAQQWWRRPVAATGPLRSFAPLDILA